MVVGIRDLAEAIKKLSWKPPKPIFCPRCGSSRIRPLFPAHIWQASIQYLCEDCGYVGVLVLEAEKEE